MTVIELQNAGESSNESQIQPINRDIREGNEIIESVFCECVLCKIPKKVSYKDVLILEQFMRLDGTVLPEEITGLISLTKR
jgi:ribosomal protein S18